MRKVTTTTSKHNKHLYNNNFLLSSRTNLFKESLPVTHGKAKNGDAEVHVDIMHQRVSILILRYAMKSDETQFGALIPERG